MNIYIYILPISNNPEWVQRKAINTERHKAQKLCNPIANPNVNNSVKSGSRKAQRDGKIIESMRCKSTSDIDVGFKCGEDSNKSILVDPIPGWIVVIRVMKIVIFIPLNLHWTANMDTSNYLCSKEKKDLEYKHCVNEVVMVSYKHQDNNTDNP